MLSWAAILVGVSTAGGPPGAGNYFHSSTWATIRDGSGDILSSESIADSGKLQMLSAEETKAVTDDDPLWRTAATGGARDHRWSRIHGPNAGCWAAPAASAVAAVAAATVAGRRRRRAGSGS